MSSNLTDEQLAAAEIAEREGSLVCRICGLLVQSADIDDSRWAGSSTFARAFVAHDQCWEAQPPRAEWAYPIDD